MTTRALIVVDVQNDFCEGGKLAVPGGTKAATDISNYIFAWREQYETIVYTMDWHKPWPETNGGHFASLPCIGEDDEDGVWHCAACGRLGSEDCDPDKHHGEPDYVDSWPPHCEQGTDGALLHEVLGINIYAFGEPRYDIFYKGDGRPDYSGFQGVNHKGLSLYAWLADFDVTEVDVVGIAGDYCVIQTALDAKKMGFHTRILPQFVASVGGTHATREAVARLDNAE